MPAMVDRCAFVGDNPWWIGVEREDHGQGEYLGQELVTAREIQERAGMTWEVGMAPAVIQIPIPNVSDVNGLPVFAHVEIPNQFGIYRKDTGTVLGQATARYEPVQPQRCFDQFDEVLAGGNGKPLAAFEVAGSLDEGRIIWILARLPGDLVVNGSDIVRNYILLANGYTGNFSFQMMNTPVRVVCQNTLNVAIDNGTNRSGYRLSHFRNINRRMNATEAREALGLVISEAESFGEGAKRLGQIPVSEEELRGLTQRLFPVPALPDAVGPEKAILEGSLLLLSEPRAEDYTPAMDFANLFQKREVVESLYRTGKGNDNPDVAGTRWAAFNAVAEYTDYVAGWDNKRNESLLFGNGRDLKQQAWNLLRKAPE